MTRDRLNSSSIAGTKGGGEKAERIEKDKVTTKCLYTGDSVQHLFEN